MSMTYAEHHRRLIDYLEAKVAAADWHAVSDAANDLRELEAEERARAERIEITGTIEPLQSCARGFLGEA